MASDLSIIISWADRPEIATTLARNESAFRESNAEVLIVNCGGNATELSRLISRSGLRNYQLITLPGRRFNKSLALNAGAQYSRSPALFVLDADVILTPGFLREALAALDGQSFVTVRRLKESEGPANGTARPSAGVMTSMTRSSLVEVSFSDGTKIQVPTSRWDLIDGSRAGPGLIMMEKSHFLRVNGYNSCHEAWGWEDVDMLLRLRCVLGLRQIELGEAVHLTHGDDQRALFGLDSRRSSRRNTEITRERFSRGDFSGTYETDIAAWKDSIVAEDFGEGLERSSALESTNKAASESGRTQTLK